jgi:CO/xanthine dehydrogenase FAD-binding subunit
MRVLRPGDWPEALRLRSAEGAAIAIAGGTDVMVAMRREHMRPEALLDLSHVHTLKRCHVGAGYVHIGSGVTYTYINEHLSGRLPGLAEAAGGIGSRQVRNRGTIGGSLGTASAAGDVHPVLIACGADIKLSSAGGSRWVPAAGFYLPAGRTALGTGELIEAVRVPVSGGFQRYAKIGRRRGVVKAICSVATVLDSSHRRVRVGIGAPGMVPLRALAAEELLTDTALWRNRTALSGDLLEEFGQLTAQAADPHTDLAATAAYRRHAIAVLARRGLVDVWGRYRESGPVCGSA